MIWEGLHKDLVVTDLDAVSAEEVFQKLGGKLVETGYCKESYIDALITREKVFRQESIWVKSELQCRIQIGNM